MQLGDLIAKVAMLAIVLTVLAAVPGGAAAMTPKPSDLTLSNESIRLRFHRPGPGKFDIWPQGFTGYTIDLKAGSTVVSGAPFPKQRWVSMARAPYFTAYSYRSGWGRDWLAYVIPAQGEIQPDGHSAVFKDTKWDFDGVKWEFTFEFTLKPGADWIDVTYSAKPDKQSKLLLMWGPRLYAGDGSFGDAKDEALFAGLDYLGPNDRSSANPALAPDCQMRFAPTPAKITIPLMCVVQGGRMIGLMWDPMQKWYGEETCPTAVFASPNWIEDKKNHLMGLYVPSVPKYAAENGFRAHTPAVIDASQTVSLSCRIFAAPGKHVTDAVDLYLKATGGLPQPVEKPMDYDAALQMLLTALTGDAWDANAGGWPWEYGADPKTAPWLQTALLMAESGSVAKNEEAVRIGRQVIAQHLERPLEMGLRVGGVSGGLEYEKTRAQDRMKDQGPDGSWGYKLHRNAEGGLMSLNAPPEPGVIAPEGTKGQGLTAGGTAALLAYVKLTGDETAWKAALKGLAQMDTYSIPGLYYTYECPQSPTLHGSYLGVRCNLIAYEITGDKRYLERAVYWAKTGLPFIYLWSLGPKEVGSGYIHGVKKVYLKGDQLYKNTTRAPMLYGGLYGYGSSQYSHHWFGILVHWIPLVYARDITELAKYDNTLQWRRIADGILTSALWQTYDQPPYAGFLPDAFSLDSWTPSGPAFSPGLLLQTLMPVHYGVECDPQTVIVRDGATRCHVTSSVKPQDVKLAGGSLTFAVNDPDWPFTRVIVAGIGGGVEVLADGKPIPKVEELESKDECWSAGPASTMLIKMKSGEKPRQIECRMNNAE
jgi:hypothetical protein